MLDTINYRTFDDFLEDLECRVDIEFMLNGRRGWIGAQGDEQLGMCGFPTDECVVFHSPEEILNHDMGGGDKLRDVWRHLSLLNM